ncbi:putative RNA-directed DNA polymerase [Tanacetum coccineum]
MSTGRICISMKQKHFLPEEFRFHHQKESGCNDKDSGCKDKDILADDFVDVASEEKWDDYLQKMDIGNEGDMFQSDAEKKSESNENAEILPPHIKDDIQKEDLVKVDVESEASCPPGFEHLKKQRQGEPKNSLSSKTSKCSTSFAKYRKKDIRGISLIHEMSRMIEVGGTLGYDVKGCRRSLHKMINCIGVQETKMTRLELFRLKSMWGNYTFDYACSLARGSSGGLISLWDPNLFMKSNIWCDKAYIIVQGQWNNSDGDFLMVNIYEPQDSSAKSSLWSRIRLIDLPMGGRLFTWMNKEGTKMSKLDHFLVSENVLDNYPDIKVTALDQLWSDHNPVLLYIKKLDYSPIPFKFFHSWLQRPDLNVIIKETWAEFSHQNVSTRIQFHTKLKELKKKIKVWHANVKQFERTRQQEILTLLKSLEEKIDSGRASNGEREERIILLQECDDLEKMAAMDMVQKARIRWDVEGDENTKKIHGMIKQRRRRQMVQGLTIDGVWVSNPNEVKTAFLNFYKEKFQAQDSSIRAAVWACGSNKALGPDGFSFHFLKKYWELISYDVTEFVTNFFDSCSMPSGANSAFITLIPKVANPLYIKDYRPISLIGVQYKIIAKLLANRLSKVVHKIVNHEQSAFISGRHILDGLLMLSEVIEWYKKQNEKLMIFKVNFEKAYDSVCLHSARTSILVNGSPSSEFSIKRELRQGDPLSPFLFILVMEGLHLALKDAVQSNLIHGAKVGASNFRISHLFYADDVVIVSDWSPRDMDNIIRVLQVFYLALGLKINIYKSNVYGIGVSTEEVSDMARVTGCAAGIIPFIYLGLPIGSNMKRTTNWNKLVDLFRSKLSSWKASLLSIGGRLTLIKSVLGSVGIYYMSIFKVPETILKSLERLRATFFWGGNEERKKLAWIKWVNVLASFDKGGLAVGSLKAVNLALLQKWRWRLVHNPDALWVQLIKAVHGPDAGFDQNGCQSQGLWAKIVGSINQLHSSGIIPMGTLKLKVGYGSRVRFWKDTWLGDGPLKLRYNRLFRLDRNEDCYISDRILNGEWSWNWSREVLGGRNTEALNLLLAEIGNVEVGSGEDSWQWGLHSDGSFSVGVTRKHIDDIILPSMITSTGWNKVNIFIWRLLLDRLPRRLNLSYRGLEIPSILCPVCNVSMESTDHIFFSCDTAANVWHKIRNWSDVSLLHLYSNSDWIEWLEIWNASNARRDRMYVIIAATLWWLWRYRNNVTFCSQSMRQCDIFDNIHLVSFSWLKSRGVKTCNWSD